jgi:NitT/TauT family transport system substrate-binding protein
MRDDAMVSASWSRPVGTSPARGRRGRFLARAFALALVVPLATACSLLGGSSDSSSGPSTGPVEHPKLKVAVLQTIDLAPFELAVKNGYFKQEGLDVETVNAPSGQAALDKLIGGDADVAISSDMPFFVAASKGMNNIRFVADGTATQPNSTVIMAGPNSPVKNVRDLAGKKIGISAPNTATDILTKALMATDGVDYSKVQWVQLGFPDIVNALARGDIDASGSLPEPFVTQAAKMGATRIADTGTGPTQDFPLTVYAGLSNFTDANPKTVAAFQRVMKRAVAECGDRAKIEPLIVQFAHVEPDVAALLTLPRFGSTLDASRLQRVPDLLMQFGVINNRVDAKPMIAPQATS